MFCIWSEIKVNNPMMMNLNKQMKKEMKSMMEQLWATLRRKMSKKLYHTSLFENQTILTLRKCQLLT
jgi:hypothetical protein